MKTKVTKEEVSYTCNECWKHYNDNNIAIEEIDEFWLLLFEKSRWWYSDNLVRHYTWRTELDFCSTPCARNYMYKKSEIFIKEVTKQKIPTQGQVL